MEIYCSIYIIYWSRGHPTPRGESSPVASWDPSSFFQPKTSSPTNLQRGREDENDNHQLFTANFFGHRRSKLQNRKVWAPPPGSLGRHSEEHMVLAPDVLLACEVLERALEAFLRGCRPHARCAGRRGVAGSKNVARLAMKQIVVGVGQKSCEFSKNKTAISQRCSSRI